MTAPRRTGCANAPVETSAGRSSGNDTAAVHEAVKFARCMRDNGVEDFPDPAPGEPLVDTSRIPSAADNGGLSIVNAAMQACRDVAAEAAGQ